ncbi:unnamed protein product [Amoebophrya sp. A120]|nr:unnamed protein product [Amoebophrya sp. A120]|eukprot:GSA120T00024426001.1
MCKPVTHLSTMFLFSSLLPRCLIDDMTTVYDYRHRRLSVPDKFVFFFRFYNALEC